MFGCGVVAQAQPGCPAVGLPSWLLATVIPAVTPPAHNSQAGKLPPVAVCRGIQQSLSTHRVGVRSPCVPDRLVSHFMIHGCHRHTGAAGIGRLPASASDNWGKDGRQNTKAPAEQQGQTHQRCPENCGSKRSASLQPVWVSLIHKFRLITFFLSRRRMSEERTEERGCLRSPPLSPLVPHGAREKHTHWPGF